MLFQVDPLDLETLAGAALLVVAASLLAAYVPTRRAMRFDPAAIIRSQQAPCPVSRLRRALVVAGNLDKLCG